ncbi:MAG: putative bifunctional diguanylate cyclase/phosphodiesterase [Solirubrobacterales bacterium]
MYEGSNPGEGPPAAGSGAEISTGSEDGKGRSTLPGELAFAIDERGRFSYLSDGARDVYGYDPDEMVGRPVTEFIAGNARRDRHVLAAIRDGMRHRTYRTEHRDRDGAPVELRVTVVGVHDSEGRLVGAAGTARDLRDEVATIERRRSMESRDPVTGLEDRSSFERRLADQIEHVERYGAHGAVVVLDIDGFGDVNESLGHRAGDDVLRQLGVALDNAVRGSDSVAKLDGDEFGVLLAEGDAEDADAAAEHLLQVVRELRPRSAAEGVHLTACVGVALVEQEMNAEQVLSGAFLALDQAKEGGCDGLEVLDRGSADRERLQRYSMVGRLRDALAEDRFELFCQPIQLLDSDAFYHYELLLRMREPDGRLLAPKAFLSTAERCGLIPEIDLWVARQTVRLLDSNPADTLKGLSFNVSGRSVSDRRILDTVGELLSETGVDAGRLTVELTETAAIRNMEDAQAFADGFRDLGCRVAIDDFGAGFGSFSYLKYLTSDAVKIDGDFVRTVSSNDADRLMVKAMVDVARGLGKQTVAEWVDSEATLGVLRELGVDAAQGYAIGRPSPVVDGFGPG